MNGNFNLWLKACEEFGTKIYPLENRDNIYLFKTWKEIEIKHNYYNLDITFQVWHGDKNVYCGRNYQESLRKYKEEIHE